MNRIGLKIACLAAAGIIWIQVASTTVAEADLHMAIEVVNLPAGLALSGAQLPKEAVVRVRAAKLRVIAHKYLHQPLGRVELDLGGRQPGTPFLYEITPADVRTAQEVVAVLPPARLPLRLDSQDHQRVPIEVVVSGQLPAGKVLLSPPTVSPREVSVSGPQRQLRDVRSIATEPVALDGLTVSRSAEVMLVVPQSELRLDPARVDVTVMVADLGIRVVADVPLTVVGVGHRDIAVSPSQCDVTIEGPADSVRALRPADLRVVVDAAGESRGGSRLRARVEHPAWVTRATVAPETFVLLAGDGQPE